MAVIITPAEEQALNTGINTDLPDSGKEIIPADERAAIWKLYSLMKAKLAEIGDYAAVGHGHEISHITGLVNALDGIASDIQALDAAVATNGTAISGNATSIETYRAQLESLQQAFNGIEAGIALTVANNLNETEAGKVLDATQGRILKEMVDGIQQSISLQIEKITGQVEAATKKIEWIVSPKVEIRLDSELWVTNPVENLPVADWNGTNIVAASSMEFDPPTAIITGIIPPTGELRRCDAFLLNPAGYYDYERGPEGDRFVAPSMIDNRLIAAYIMWGDGGVWVVEPDKGIRRFIELDDAPADYPAGSGFVPTFDAVTQKLIWRMPYEIRAFDYARDYEVGETFRDRGIIMEFVTRLPKLTYGSSWQIPKGQLKLAGQVGTIPQYKDFTLNDPATQSFYMAHVYAAFGRCFIQADTRKGNTQEISVWAHGFAQSEENLIYAGMSLRIDLKWNGVNPIDPTFVNVVGDTTAPEGAVDGNTIVYELYAYEDGVFSIDDKYILEHRFGMGKGALSFMDLKDAPAEPPSAYALPVFSAQDNAFGWLNYDPLTMLDPKIRKYRPGTTYNAGDIIYDGFGVMIQWVIGTFMSNMPTLYMGLKALPRGEFSEGDNEGWPYTYVSRFPLVDYIATVSVTPQNVTNFNEGVHIVFTAPDIVINLAVERHYPGAPFYVIANIAYSGCNITFDPVYFNEPTPVIPAWNGTPFLVRYNFEDLGDGKYTWIQNDSVSVATSDYSTYAPLALPDIESTDIIPVQDVNKGKWKLDFGVLKSWVIAIFKGKFCLTQPDGTQIYGDNAQQLMDLAQPRALFTMYTHLDSTPLVHKNSVVIDTKGFDLPTLMDSPSSGEFSVIGGGRIGRILLGVFDASFNPVSPSTTDAFIDCELNILTRSSDIADGTLDSKFNCKKVIITKPVVVNKLGWLQFWGATEAYLYGGVYELSRGSVAADSSSIGICLRSGFTGTVYSEGEINCPAYYGAVTAMDGAGGKLILENTTIVSKRTTTGGDKAGILLQATSTTEVVLAGATTIESIGPSIKRLGTTPIQVSVKGSVSYNIALSGPVTLINTTANRFPEQVAAPTGPEIVQKLEAIATPDDKLSFTAVQYAVGSAGSPVPTALIWRGTQAAFDAIPSKDPAILYFVQI